MASDKYRWSFFRAGGVDQVVLADGDDLAHLDELDQKLWLALSCPTRGLEFDGRTLDLIDTDHDGHIRPGEILGVVRWARDAFRRLKFCSAAGTRCRWPKSTKRRCWARNCSAEAKHILQSLGRPDADTISLDDIADTAKILAATRFNGDGILPVESAGDEGTAQALRDIIATLGSKPDRSGQAGVDQATVDKFFDEAAAYVAWLDQGTDAIRVVARQPRQPTPLSPPCAPRSTTTSRAAAWPRSMAAPPRPSTPSRPISWPWGRRP
jgi:hypothetical protein